MKLIALKATLSLLALLFAAYCIISYQDNEMDASTYTYAIYSRQSEINDVRENYTKQGLENATLLARFTIDESTEIAERILMKPRTKKKINDALDELISDYFNLIGYGLKKEIGNEAALDWNRSIRALSADDLRDMLKNPEKFISNKAELTTPNAARPTS